MAALGKRGFSGSLQTGWLRLRPVLGLLQIFNQTALRMGISLTMVHKKINVSSTEVAWEHEAFAYKKIVAATLSDHPSAIPQFTRSSALDTRYR